MKTIKTNPNVIRRNVAGEDILIPIGDSALEHNGLFVLTPTGAEIWDALVEGKSLEEIVANIAEEYGIDTETIRKDVLELIERLAQLGLVTE
jgi:DNA-binding CsgD family transcriptional regulator